MKFYYLLIILLLSNFSFALGIEIYYPTGNQELCSSTPVEIKWNGIASDVDVLVKSEQNAEFQKILNYEVVGNTFKWKVSVEEFFNVPLTFRISNRNNSNEFDEVGGITVFRDIEIIEQTNSLQICEGEDILLDIEAIGYDLKYHWFKDGQMIPNANSQVLYISQSNHSNSGTYTCSIESNGICYEKEIAPISVYVTTGTKFLTIPENVFWEYQYNGKMDARFHANINDSNNVIFQWYKDTIIFVKPEGGGTLVPRQIRLKLQDGKKYTGTQSHDFVVKNMVWGDRTEYHCIAEGLCGVDSVTGSIGAQKYFRIIKKSPDYFGCDGIDVKFKAIVETNETGTLTYQWYRSGFVKLEEGERFTGTQTLELTMHKPNRLDNSTYYVLVTLAEKKVYDRSEAFTYMPQYKPDIALQPYEWVIHAPRNYEKRRLYFLINVYNEEKCYYQWYKGDSLVASTGENNFYRKTNVQPSDTGWYRVKIRNNCGIIWGDSMYVAWGFEDYNRSTCMKEELVVTVDDYGDDYYYEWIFKGNVIVDSDSILHSKTNKLKFTSLKAGDEGDYKIYIINKNTQYKTLIGIIRVTTEEPPKIVRDFPKTQSNIGYRMPIFSIIAVSKGKGLYYILYIDGQAQNTEQYIAQDIYENTDYGFVFGGMNSNLKPGVYQYRFRNECGTTWSTKMTLINENYVE